MYHLDMSELVTPSFLLNMSGEDEKLNEVFQFTFFRTLIEIISQLLIHPHYLRFDQASNLQLQYRQPSQNLLGKYPYREPDFLS